MGPVSSGTPPLLAIGASAGGPQALASILSHFPSAFPAITVVIQHVAAEFSDSLINWLGTRTVLPVRQAVQGTRPERGTIYVAGTDEHLIVTPEFRFVYTPEPWGIPFRPSVDVFFQSLVARRPAHPGLRKCTPTGDIAVLLSGMGQDGARGLLSLRRRGWYTIAQDEATSAVYGMPRAARALGAACAVLPVDDIGPVILSVLNRTVG
ncbi:chemotaxis response regulator protein-glutamate methylesterase [Desulfonema ishimotonii]|uniref:protein-glutamate methylesterase n=1 Tax=Desulfonema ishimotonii TaxID=45657 RepID=A0A401G2D5_9BACT|nr:chemotaxis protein CheB [Desulfonema ishimotonii]GBC63399.1 chemotaxis response regulator protein-glutamate methylesterase [Desulfonema ishimotonii]